MENANTAPLVHRLRIPLQAEGVDRETNFAWCQFRRPIAPENVYDLDFRQPMYHFYLWDLEDMNEKDKKDKNDDENDDDESGNDNGVAATERLEKSRDK